MKVVTNERLIRRNRKIGQYLTIGSLAILGIGLYLSFQTANPQAVTFSFVALIVGFVLSQVGIYFGNRWGRSPRPDEALISNLKGLSDSYTLYNYATPIPHLLVGPTGLWALIPYHQSGKIVYEKGRWKQKGGNMYMKIFAQDNIGRPDQEIRSEQDTLKARLSKSIGEDELPAIQAALVFVNEKTVVEADDAPIPTLKAAKLKDFLRKQPKDASLTPDKLETINEAVIL